MAFNISPRVNVYERNFSLRTDIEADTIGAMCGYTSWGEVEKPQSVNSEDEFIERYQKSDPNNNTSQLIAADFLRYGGKLLYNRVVGPKARNSVVSSPTSPQQVSCEGASSRVTISPDLNYGNGWDGEGSYDGSITWNIEVDGVLREINAGIISQVDDEWLYMEDWINDNLGDILNAEYDNGIIINNIDDILHRIRLIPSSVPSESPIDISDNPTYTVDEVTGVISFCLSNSSVELADMEPLAFHITSIEESSGWFEVDFWDVPIGTEIIVDWGDGSPIEKLIASSDYVNPYHYYATSDHIAKFTVNNPVGGWFCQSANIDSVISFGAVQAESIQLNKTDRLVSVPTILPSYIKNIQLGGKLLNDPVISNWDTSNLTDMTRMFLGAYAFNQDLSGWCVPLILTEPNGFAESSALTQAHKPVWGTCPSGV